ncbi:MAG: transcription termination/antitermination protein NusA [Candidatus Pacebacteria bacterium]|nr:transcription termination/antitermination protein NusA [Candidatus Paceibacterota bacterium]
MLDVKTIRQTLGQLEEERGIPADKVIDAIEHALAAAYKKDYGKKGQIVRANFDLDSGKTEFYQVKIAVEESMLKPELEEGEEEVVETPSEDSDSDLIRFNPEHHIMINDAKMIKKDVEPGEEIIFPLEARDDYGRIAAQTAKQVIIQRIREAEKVGILNEYGQKQEEIVNGTVQRLERGNIFVDLGKATGILPYDEQIRSERFKQGERIRAYLFAVEETPRGINLKLSRSHPKFIQKLFEMEAPEIAAGTVEIMGIAREAGSRSKIAVVSHEENIDPVGSCVGQRGVRVATVMSELGGEKIDIIEWSENPEQFIEDALSPAQVQNVAINEEEKQAVIEVQEDQLSLAIGKGGQNVRLAAKLTGWKIDIKGIGGEDITKNGEEVTDGKEERAKDEDSPVETSTEENASDTPEETKDEVSEETSEKEGAEKKTEEAEEKEEKKKTAAKK